MWVLVFSLIACDPAVESVDECIATTGNNCDCEHKCLTQREIDKIDSFCDLGCPDETWECAVEDGSCVVADTDAP